MFLLQTTCRAGHEQTGSLCPPVVLPGSQTQPRGQRRRSEITGKNSTATKNGNTRILFSLQAVFLSATLPREPQRSSRVWRVAKRQLFSLWQSRPGLASKYLSRLLAAEESLPSLCLLSLLAEHCYQTGNLDSSQQVCFLSLFSRLSSPSLSLSLMLQEALLNYYRKVVLMSRSKPFQPIVVCVQLTPFWPSVVSTGLSPAGYLWPTLQKGHTRPVLLSLALSVTEVSS